VTLDETVFVHPLGVCESDDVGARTRVWAFAHILPGAKVGADCNVCDHAYVESGVVVGDRVTIKNAVLLFDGVVVEDDVFLGPNVVFTNDLVPRAANKKSHDELFPTFVRRGATIGANATIVCGTTIGAHAFIGSGTVVNRDVPPHALVVGNPGRAIGWMCECGERLDDTLVCKVCQRAYRLAAFGLESA
jgi:UDP-2-acetamido-3-amino-2,3-dideoxy-glucuronate N-acetyltransferase